MEGKVVKGNRITEGSIFGQLLLFFFPILFGTFFQQLYNTADAMVVGRFVGKQALAAVGGSTSTLINLLVGFFVGLSSGATVVISQFYGARKADKVHWAVHTSIAFSVIGGIIFMIVGLVGSPWALEAMKTPEDVMGHAVVYIRIYFLGIIVNLVYNMGAGILRAVGDSRRPLYFLIASCFTNIILDVLLVAVLGMGVAGAALATITGQIVSALLAVYYLFRPKSFRLKRVSFKPDAEILKHVLPLGISSFLTQVSIVVIMAVMNNVLVIYGAGSKYGADIPMTVVGIVMKVFQIVISVVVGIAAGAQPIVGYNYGAGLWRRVKLIFRTMMAAEFSVGLVSLICFEVFPVQIISVFGSEDGLYNEFAVLAFRVFLGGIVLCCIQKSCSIFLQSMGKPALSMLLSLLRDFVLSVPLTLVLPRFFGVTGALYSGPAADVISFGAAVLCMAAVFRKLNRLEDGEVALSGASQGGLAVERKIC